MIDRADLAAAFERRYGSQSVRPRVFRAPGRVNLIGEHTDYNEGFVLPMAIDRETVVAIAKRSDRIVRIWSLNLDETVELDLDRLGSGGRGNWIDYVEGIAAALAQEVRLSGADIALASDVGIGSGLSSSAALEISLATALTAIAGVRVSKLSLALAGQTAEHVHAGIKCGIMDQFTAAHATRNHAILLDCRSLEGRHIPIRMDDFRVVVCDSRVRHALASSEYNQRRRDCHEGVERLKSAVPRIRALRDVTFDQLRMHGSLLPETVFRRCRHVITENKRTLSAAEALQAGDVVQMGRLMSLSHQSLRDDYEVSCTELDLLVACAEAQPGVAGARMTGGGFGGCAIALVQEQHIDAFRTNVSAEYRRQTGIDPEIFVVSPCDGADEIK